MFAQLKTVEYIYSLIDRWERNASEPEIDAMQILLLGLNTTINHDLVFELVEALSPECDTLTPVGRQRDRQAFDALIDHITSVVIGAHQRLSALGIPVGLDAWVLEDLIDGWSETVWKHADALLRSHSQFETEAIRFQIDRRTARRADAILRASKLVHQIA